MTPSTPTPPPEDRTPLADLHKLSTLLEALLKHPQRLTAYLRSDAPLSRVNLGMALITGLSLLVYGVTLGSLAMGEQLWATPLKILLGTACSALICFPSLYIFTCLTGTQAGVRQIFSGLLGTLALMGILLVGFAPIFWVFSQSTYSLGFMGVLMLGSWLIAFTFGIGFLQKLLNSAGAERLRALNVWTVIFLLVTLQMSTSLRPILGSADSHLTSEKKFFIQHWIQSIGTTVAETPPPAPSTQPANQSSTQPSR